VPRFGSCYSPTMPGTIRKELVHFNTAGHAHALTFSCRHRMPLLAKDRSRLWMVGSLKRACDRHDFECLAFVVMPEHVHTIVAPRSDQYDISKFLQSVKQSVSLQAKRWLRENNPMWLRHLTFIDGNGQTRFRFWQQGGGYDRNVFDPATLVTTIQYIHNNPVRRGLVTNPCDWRWSSAEWYECGCRGSIFDDSLADE
jgi:REP-associated tyrosine transposase